MDTEGLREYMSKFGELEDCIVLKVSLYYVVRAAPGVKLGWNFVSGSLKCVGLCLSSRNNIMLFWVWVSNFISPGTCYTLGM